MKKIMISGGSLVTLVALSIALCVIGAACAPEETFRSTGIPKDLAASPLPGSKPTTDLNHPGTPDAPGTLGSSGNPPLPAQVPASIASGTPPLAAVPDSPMPGEPGTPSAGAPSAPDSVSPARAEAIPSIPGSSPQSIPIPGSQPLPSHIESPFPPRVIVKETELEINDEVLFVFDRADLTHYAEVLLDEVASTLISEKGKFKQILIWGHTDAVGSADYNLRLSMARAKAVYRYLVEVRHIDPRLMSYEGFGVTQLKDSSNPESEVNRRVEFKIIR